MARPEEATSAGVDDEEKKIRRRDRNPCLKFLVDNWFMLATIAGVCLGFGLAFTVRATQPGEVAITWICKF